MRAAVVSAPSEMWAIGDDLYRQRQGINRTFDYRYSQLIRVFAELIHKGFMHETVLAGLADAKRSDIRRKLSSFKAG